MDGMNDSICDSASPPRAAAADGVAAAEALAMVALAPNDVDPEAPVLLARTSKASRVGGGMDRLAVKSFPRNPSSCSGR